MTNPSPFTRWLRLLAAVAALTVLAAACASDDDDGDTAAADTTTTVEDAEPTDSTEPTDTTETTDPADSGPATGEPIKIGVTYVDTEALAAVNLDFDLGDHEAVYSALAEDINANGGINGRPLEVVFAPVDPTSPAGADAACVSLTEDEQVFLVTGFFLNDTMLCPLELNDTAVVGGSMTPSLVERANAPWVTWLPDTDQPGTVIRNLAERGELDGEVAVFATIADTEDLEDHVLPVLEELGIEPVEVGIMDAPTDDPAALDANVDIIAERFESQGADTVLIVGANGATWPQYQFDAAYRPKLLFLELSAPRAFATSGANTDLSILEGSLSGGGYGFDQARFEEPAMQECVEVLAAAGVETPAPSEFDADDTSNQPYQAAFQACPDMALTRALLSAAESIDNDAVAAAIDGLELVIPGDPTTRTYGPPPAADGNPDVYLFGWDPAASTFVLIEE